MISNDSVLNLPDDVRMLDVVRDAMDRANDVRIAVSFTRCSGLGLLIDPMRSVIDRGGRVRVLTSTYQAVTQPEALEVLGDLPGIEDLKASGLLDKRPAVESVTGQSGLFPAGWTPEEGANDFPGAVSGDSGDESDYSADEDAA